LPRDISTSPLAASFDSPPRKRTAAQWILSRQLLRLRLHTHARLQLPERPTGDDPLLTQQFVFGKQFSAAARAIGQRIGHQLWTGQLG
jgi:hypothetical protein